MARRALVLVNRNSRRGDQDAGRALELLHELGIELLEKKPKSGAELSELIRRHRDEVDMVIVGGGDGSLNAAADGLVETQLPLGIVPLGTANDLARTLGIPADIENACRTIAQFHSKRIDLGSVNGHHFFNVASVGLTVRITQQLSKESKSRWGVVAYLFTAARVLFQSRPFYAEIRGAIDRFQVKTIQIAIGNGRHYGGGMTITDDAAIDDARLDLYSLEIDHWWQIIRLLPAMRYGTLWQSPHVRTLKGQEFEICLRKERPLTADGELVTSTPARFRLYPAALSVFVPRADHQPAPTA